MKPDLKIIKATHRPVVDIYGPWRAEVEARDWASIHVAGDKREPLFIPDVLKRIWRG